ncbi:AMP-binding protein [Pararobbsia silviterrae]|uniref:Beta-hydroxyacyl-ACP dehydratase n=1 Tax=Pararobbsia silviterrae TaxID=1792498 RepID=A0A494XG87_9BURK|nr:AMP-binding protein [Pararobbsia silviterrae]RKP46603.1 beta-hydroxyacyl-ACP dehydratase [Pararobbsia silviterrae]
MTHLALIAHRHADAIVARHRGMPITAARFIADVRTVAATLPAGTHLLNACGDRYAFAVTLAAAMLDHRITLLPSTYTPEAVERLKEFAPDTFCVADSHTEHVALPTFRYPIALPWEAAQADRSETEIDANGDGDGEASVERQAGAETGVGADAGPRAGSTAFEVPRIHADRVVAYVFTSGSTGVPVPHPKTWGRLVHSVHVAKTALGLDDTRPHTLVGTVPPQHMFGFESTVLLALIGAQIFETGRPFYPADVIDTLASAPEPRLLVTTPVHLRSLLSTPETPAAWPALGLILSATAPLSQTLAEQAEQRFAGPLKEIYGSTETGQIATRRTATDTDWLLMPGIRLSWQNTQAWASEGHIETPTPLGDLLEPRGEPDADGYVRRFVLTGRTADLVNIAGKRTSIGYLNHQIASIDGVEDAGFYLPDDETPGIVTRLAAFAVAPGLSANAILTALRQRVDPAFLPRPLVLVDALPRNETGKLVRATLKSLYERHVAAQKHARAPAQTNDAPLVLPIPHDHPAYAGHFPGRPVLPGVVLLDAALDAIAHDTGRAVSACALASVKFLSPVTPGETLTLERKASPSGAIEFTIRASERIVARGTVAS